MITKFARLEFELFTKPSKSDFLRVHQKMNGNLIFVGIFYHNLYIAYDLDLFLKG
jgi:hypothetical protein